MITSRLRDRFRLEADVDPAVGDDVDYRTRLARATQQVRVQQSVRTMPLVSLGALVFAVTFWNDAPAAGILAWVLCVVLATALRSVLVRRIRPRIGRADLAQLQGFERLLFLTSMGNAVCIGSGFWWVALGGTQQAAYAVTLLCSVYAIGSMINASVQYRSFAPTVVVNLGQGVLFALGLGFWDPLIAVSLFVIMMLQLGFGRANAAQFAETIRIRTENLRLVEQLREEKQAVERALSAAREANESKSHFLAAASHDLRQPLHALSLYLGSLALQLENQRDKELLDRIIDATEVLRGQFDALLDLSQFDAHGVQTEITDLRIDLLLTRLAAEFEHDARTRNLGLHVDVDRCIVRSDALQLERLLRNLLENAVRYTQEGSITLSARQDGDTVRVAVEDTGPGISPEDQTRVFQDFVQLHNQARRRASGVGLGLAIVRRINDLLKLDLRLESAEGVGTRFELSVPFVRQAPADTLRHTFAPLPTPQGAAGCRVWAIDDDESVREALKSQLEAWGCEVTLGGAWSDVEARYRHGDTPDLVLIDDMLGGDETGLDIANRLDERLAHQRIAIITGNTQPARLQEIRESGFQVLLKPTRTQQLWRLVQASSCRGGPGDQHGVQPPEAAPTESQGGNAPP